MRKKTIALTTVFLGIFLSSQFKMFAQNTKNKHMNEKNATTRIGEKSTTITYTPPENLETSADFTVNVNNTAVWTETVGNGGMENLNVANFSCSGKQTITIKASEIISKYSIRPKSRNITAQVKGKELTFTIPGPQKLYIEINNLPHLAIFANPLEDKLPDTSDTNVVYYGPGIHTPGLINLKNNQTLYIAGGAVVNANIRGNNLQNIKILGRGNLNGNLQIGNSSNIDVEGIFMRSTRGWTNTLIDCYNSSYRNVKVFSYKSVWGLDGINPVSCKNFTIDDCFIRTKDDCIAVKSMPQFGGYTANDINTDSITVINNLLVGWSHADGFTMGFELQGGVAQNVLVKNCDILMASGQGRTGGHSGFSIVCDGASMVQNIRFEDIRVEAQIEYKNLELIITEGRRYGTGNAGHIKGVYLKNIHWENANKPFVIAGVPSNILEDVSFDNCFLAGKLITGFQDADFQMEFAKDIKFITSKNSGGSNKEMHQATLTQITN